MTKNEIVAGLRQLRIEFSRQHNAAHVHWQDEKEDYNAGEAGAYKEAEKRVAALLRKVAKK